MLTEFQQKLLVGGLVGISLISFVSAISESPQMPARDMMDVPEASVLTQEMPESSSYTYGTEELITINDVTSKGLFLRQYKRTFTNLTHRDYDVSATYRDFDRDMEQYNMYLKQAIMKLRAQRPARDVSKQSQADSLERIEKLYREVSKYKQHEHSINDTLEYLGNCIYELDRVSLQAKLPQ